YVETKLQKKRLLELEKRKVEVSKITAKDKKTFEEAHKILCGQRVEPIKIIKSSRSLKSLKSLKAREGINICPMFCKKPSTANEVTKHGKSSTVKLNTFKLSRGRKGDRCKPLPKKVKPVIVIPPFKTKPWNPVKIAVMSNHKAVVVIPPVKTKPWVPESRAKPKFHPVIEMPTLTLRKSPWKPPLKDQPSIRKPLVLTRVRLQKTFFPSPCTTLGKTWHLFKYLNSKVMILRGRISQYSKKFNYVSNGKQSAFISIIALVTAFLQPQEYWTPDVLDEIINYGDINFRKQMRHFHRHAIIKPPEIKLKVYVKRAKVITQIGVRTHKGIFESDNLAEPIEQMTNILQDYKGLIFSYCDYNYAIWKENSAFYIFNSEDTDSNGQLAERNHGSCCVVRSSNSLSAIVDYLASCLRLMKKRYEIYSFRINEKVSLEEEIEKVLNPHAIQEAAYVEFEKTIENMVDEKPESFLEVELPNCGIAAVMLENQSVPDFSDDFNQISEYQGYLRGKEFLDQTQEDSRKSSFISSAAIVMLRMCKSSMWKTKTLDEIFKIGNQIYEDYADEKKETPITETFPIVNYARHAFELIAENVIFGKITSRQSDVMTLDDGLKVFFKSFDCGIIQGPDKVAVWRENELYFLFDPNQCRGLSRASSKKISYEDDVVILNSCLSWFQNLSDLVNLYVENLDKTCRQGVFKICKLEVLKHVKKAENWYNFKGIGKNKWILNGTISESSEEFSVRNRNHQSTCMSAVAIGKTCELGVQSWTCEIVDEILILGDEYYSGSVILLHQKEQFIEPDLTVNELGLELKMKNFVIDYTFEDCSIDGTLLPSTPEDCSLEKGLTELFDTDEPGIVISCGISLSVWKWRGFYYVFDSHGRDAFGRNLKMTNPIQGCFIPGAACIMRFATIPDLSLHLLSNFEIDDNPAFNICRVVAEPRLSTAPCFYHYCKIENLEYAAMLRSYHEFHEDHESYIIPRSIMKEKTLCNILSCLGFTKILNPRQWSNSDINEILKIGYKVLCRFAKNATSSDEHDLQIEINSITFDIEVVKEEVGHFMQKKNHFGFDLEVLEESVNINEFDGNKSATSLQPSVHSAAPSTASTILNEEDTAMTLLDVLKTWENEGENFTILESILFDLAIWKCDRFYYVFDPKSSDLQGNLTKNRLEDFVKRQLAEERNLLKSKFNPRLSTELELQELCFGRPVTFISPTVKPSMANISPKADDELLPIEISETGCAYVAWFTSLEFLNQHILHKIPSKFQSESFLVKYLKFNHSQVSAEGDMTPWHNFNPLDAQHWILRGGISQNDTQFPDFNRNNQDVPNCIISLAFLKICKTMDWDSVVLDIILKFGNRLYKKSIEKLMNAGDQQLDSLKLTINQIDLPVLMRPYVISIEDELFTKDTIVKGNEEEPMELMKKTIGMFLNTPETVGILVAKDYYVSIWKSEDHFYMFDPHDIGPDGFKKSNGVACLQRFLDFKKLVEVFCINIKDIEGANEYQLIKISVVSNYFKDMSVDDNDCGLLKLEEDLSAYSDYNLYAKNNEVSLVHAKCATVSEFNTENGSFGVCYAISAFCINQTLHPDYYTRGTIDKIVLFGNDLLAECDSECFDDFNVSKNHSCSDEINWNFELDNMLTNIQMDIFKRGIILDLSSIQPSLKNSLDEFFDFYCNGLLVTEKLVLGLWKENHKYFVFYPHLIDESGKIQNDDYDNCHPGLLSFNALDKLYLNLLANLGKEECLKSFELRSCIITMSSLKEKKIICGVEEKDDLINTEIVAPAIQRGSSKLEVAIDLSNPIGDCELYNKIRSKRATTSGFIDVEGGGILCGKLSKNSKKICSLTKKYHSGAICITAAAMTSLKDLNKWCCQTIDEIIVDGNALYIESSVANNSKEVDITNMITKMIFAGNDIQLEAIPFRNVYCEVLEPEFMEYTLQELFSCYTTGYLSRGLDCFTLFTRCKVYYIFDPLGIKVPTCSDNHHKANYRATLYKFDSFDKFVIQLLKCIDYISCPDSKECCIVGGIKIHPEKVCPVPLTPVMRTPTTKCPPKRPKCEPRKPFTVYTSDHCKCR
ncbi:unnamed protein product, partial [Diamesa serratosioi]